MSSHDAASKLLMLSVLFCGAQGDTGSGIGSEDQQWIRLCTLTTNNESSLIDVALPCSVRVGSGRDDLPEGSTGRLSEIRPKSDHDPVEYVKITLDDTAAENRPVGSSTTEKPGNTTVSDGINGNVGVDVEVVDDDGSGDMETDPGDVQETDTSDVETDTDDMETDTGDVGIDTGDVETDTSDVEIETGDVKINNRDVKTDNGDVETDTGDVEIDTVDDDVVDRPTYDEEEDVTVLTVEPNGGNVSEEREDGVVAGLRNTLKHRRPSTAIVAKVVLDYLLDARNQLYDKIHYLLNLLQRTFFNITLNCRRRRNSIERSSLLNYKRKQANKKNPSLSSVVFEPTFERSLMTMSFLMFGVFVIQVVQRLIQTIQQPGEASFMSNSVFGKLPTAPSDIF